MGKIINFVLDTLKDGIIANPKLFGILFWSLLIGGYIYNSYTERHPGVYTDFPNGGSFVSEWYKRPFSDYGEYEPNQYRAIYGEYTNPDGRVGRGRWIYRNEYGYKVGLKEKGLPTHYINEHGYREEYKEEKAPTQGTFIYPNGKKYEGGWKNGQRHGHGIFSYQNGDKYEGGWKNGQRHGHGKITHPDGYEFEGEFKDGLENGQGTASYPRDTTDMGNKKEDTIKYVGEWKEGKYHGQGTLTRGGFYGSKRVGEWKDGEFMNGKVYDKYGKIERELVNGKQIKE